MADELFIVTSVDGETRWAYTTKEEAVKANDKLQPAVEKMHPCGCFGIKCSGGFGHAS